MDRWVPEVICQRIFRPSASGQWTGEFQKESANKFPGHQLAANGQVSSRRIRNEFLAASVLVSSRRNPPTNFPVSSGRNPLTNFPVISYRPVFRWVPEGIRQQISRPSASGQWPGGSQIVPANKFPSHQLAASGHVSSRWDPPMISWPSASGQWPGEFQKGSANEFPVHQLAANGQVSSRSDLPMISRPSASGQWPGESQIMSANEFPTHQLAANGQVSSWRILLNYENPLTPRLFTLC